MKRLRSQLGVSLVETIVSLTLFAVCAASIGTFLTTQIRTASSNNLTSVAYAMAEDQLEGLRALDYKDMASSSSSKTVGSVVFNLSAAVTPDSPSLNMKKIVVQVTWNENTGSKNVTVSTVFTQVTR
jgi:type II secretory pathway pseudopilin PulG